jgi:alkylhydroperoxidase/carboxymuconolactone decarboxylase family protein YurZ
MADGEEDERRQGALQGISDNDAGAIQALIAIEVENVEASGLDARTHALVSLGALVATGADIASYIFQVDRAVDAGATPDEVIGVLVALAPTVGLAKIVSAAPNIAAALDIELDAGDEDEEER